jgi:hypothetical protein
MLEPFDSITGFAASGAGVLANDPTNKVQGTNSQRLTNNANNSAIATKTITPQLDPTTFGVYAACVDVDFLNVASIEIDIGRSNTFAVAQQTGLQEDVAARPKGKTWFARNVSELTNVPAGVGAVQVRTRYGLQSNAGLNGRMTTDALVANTAGIPTVVISFDDGYLQQYTVAKPILDAHGFKATYHPAPNYINLADGGNGNYMTTAMLQDLNANGHDIACDNMDDVPYINYADLASAVASYTANRNFLSARGLTRAIDFGCYPGGNYASTPVKFQATGASVSGNAVTLASAPTGGIVLAVGTRVYSLGLPQGGSTISALTDQQHVTLTDAPTAGTAIFLFVDESGPFQGARLPTALKGAGAKLMRTNNAVYGKSVFTRWGFADWDMYFTGNGYTGLTAANGYALVDEAILRGSTLYTYWHSIRDTGGTGFDSTVAFFTDQMDYIKSKVDAGLLQVLTVSQMYNRDADGLSRLQAMFP